MAWTSQLTKQLTHDDYTVAWICALPIEKTAARNMLDELHRAPPQPENDNNIYTLGSVCGHNVVIVCQGDMGTTAATMVATQMVATFRKLRFGLLVGIAGGVPDVEDIRLGDVVVSKGGVVAHDLGKETPSGFELRPFLNGVPELLKNAFSELESLLMDRESDITRYISNAIARNPRFSAYERPTPLVDNLFDKEYIHLNPGDKTCSECDKSQLIRQGARHSPKLHFGIVASGNQVIKNGIKRGKIAEAHPGVMAIEMEAAGLMNVFGCATIRGICDYADSHKNDGWHKYASAVAAAAAKEILSIILPPIRAATPAISMNDLISPLILSNTTNRPEWRMVLSKSKTSVDDIFERLSDYDYLRAYNMRKRRRLPNTTNWILKHPDFLAWLNGEGNPCMWLSGIVGCGKSIIMTTVIEATVAGAQSNGIPVLQFIYDHSYQRYLTALALFESYVKQLLVYLERNNKSCPPAVIAQILEFYGSGKRRPDVQELIDEILIPLYLIVEGSGVTFLVDGVDECSRQEIIEILNGLRQLLRLRSCKVFICCREEVSILRGMPKANHIRITARDTKADLEVFVDDEIERMPYDSSLSSNKVVLNSIRCEILKRADGMFLWVKYLIKMIWEDCTGKQSTDEAVYETLKRLPKDLNETYQRCLEKVNQDGRRKSLADRILRWICVSPEPFKIIQLQEALALNPDTGKFEQGLIPKEEIITCCASLASLEEDNSDELVLLAHHSVRQFIFPSGAESAYETAQVELGELCVVYLFSHRPVKEPPHHGGSFSRHIGTTLPTPAHTINSLLIPRTIKYLFPSRQNQVPVLLPKPIPRNIAITGIGFPSYAKTNWIVLTSNIPNTSPCWSKFKNLALPDDRSWDIFPWQSCRSLNSHIFELYGWSIVHSHYPLLSLAFSQREFVKKEIFGLPLFNQVGQAVLPLQAAAAAGNPRILEFVLEIPELNKQYNNALYVASSKGHLDVVRLLHNAGADINARERNQESAMQAAFCKGHRQVVQYLIYAGVNRNVQTFEGHTKSVSDVAFSPDGQLVASASNDTVRLWDAKTGTVHQIFQGCSGWVYSVTFSPDGQRVALASSGTTVRLLDVKTGAELKTFRYDAKKVYSVTFSPDGQLVASASSDKTVRLWDAKTGAAHQIFEGHVGSVFSVAFSPDGQLVASASEDETVRLWDVKTGVVHQTLEGHIGSVFSVAFSPDGRLVASASFDETVRLWDVKTGRAHQTLRGHTNSVNAVAFSPTGRLVASGSSDATVRIWNTKTGMAYQWLRGHRYSVNAVAFSPDGQLVASASHDSTVKLWVPY